MQRAQTCQSPHRLMRQMSPESLATGFPSENELRKRAIVGVPVEMYTGDKADNAFRNLSR
jgi:hypothetical protein